MNGDTQPKKLLIILMGSLGDVARGLALVPILKSARPEWELHWLVEPKWKEVVEAQPGVDRVLVFQRHRGIRGVVQICRELRSGNYEIVLDLQRHAKSGFFSRVTGAPKRIGFARADSKEFNWIFQTDHIPAAIGEVPKFLQYMEFPRLIGIVPPPTPPIPYLAAPASGQRPMSPAYAVIVLGSSWPAKDWPITGYVQAIELLLQETALQFVLLGDRSQVERAARVKEIYSTDRVQNLVGGTTLSELMHILKGATICLGPDSGPGHLAAGLGTATVTIFGPTSAARTAPLGDRARILQSTLGCAPCYRRKCPGLDTVCMRSQNPRIVVNAALDLLKGA